MKFNPSNSIRGGAAFYAAFYINPKEIPPIQRDEIIKAFMAGSVHMLKTMGALGAALSNEIDLLAAIHQIEAEVKNIQDEATRAAGQDPKSTPNN